MVALDKRFLTNRSLPSVYGHTGRQVTYRYGLAKRGGMLEQPGEGMTSQRVGTEILARLKILLRETLISSHSVMPFCMYKPGRRAVDLRQPVHFDKALFRRV